MKKFLSICLVALCSVSAMYAQETTVSEANQDGVECGSTVTVSATATHKHSHFSKWVITGFNNGTTTTETINKNENSAIFTTTNSSSMTGTNQDLEKAELTVTIDNNVINWVNTPSAIGTLTFEAFFTEDPITSITTAAVDENGNALNPGDYQVTTGIQDNYAGETVDLTAENIASSCYVFDHWAATPTGESIVEGNIYTATYGTQPTTTYYAVYKKKKVNIKVTTADNSKGIVAISVNNNPTNN